MCLSIHQKPDRFPLFSEVHDTCYTSRCPLDSASVVITVPCSLPYAVAYQLVDRHYNLMDAIVFARRRLHTAMDRVLRVLHVHLSLSIARILSGSPFR